MFKFQSYKFLEKIHNEIIKTDHENQNQNNSKLWYCKALKSWIYYIIKFQNSKVKKYWIMAFQNSEITTLWNYKPKINKII